MMIKDGETNGLNIMKKDGDSLMRFDITALRKL